MWKRSRECVWLVCIGSLFTLPVFAHPISLSSTIVDVQANQIAVEIEIMLEDLVLFHRLAADGQLKYAAVDLTEAAEKHRRFVIDYFSILDANGQRLKGQIQHVDFEQIEPVGVAQADLMRRSIRYELMFALEQSQPPFLTFVQNFGGDAAVLPALMDLHVLQNDQFAEKSTQIAHGRPHTVQFDWQEPSNGKRLTFAVLREQNAKRLKDRLGISSYTALFSFLYITPFEVRHEILIPLLTLEKWVPIVRQHPDFLEIEEQLAASQKIEDFFKERSHVLINQQLVEAKLSRLNFFGLDIKDFAFNADPRRVSIHQARVGVILTFPASQVPNHVSVQWNTFSEYAPYVQSVVLVGNEPPRQHSFQSQATTFDWSGNLTAPTVKPVKAQAAEIALANRASILQQVLFNIYHAFDFRDDEEVYDALASSVHGDLLREIYLRIKRTLLIAEQGGALSHVTSVSVDSATPFQTQLNTAFDTVWRVTGVTEHWGHVHRRTVEYRARLTLGQLEGHWKLTAFQLLDEKTIQFDTSIRGYDSN